MKKLIMFSLLFIGSITSSCPFENDWVEKFLYDMSYYEIDDSDLDHIPEISPLEPFPDKKFTDIPQSQPKTPETTPPPPPVSHPTTFSPPPQKPRKKTKKKHSKSSNHKPPALRTLFYNKHEDTFICTECEKEFDNPNELFEHLEDEHDIDSTDKTALLELIGIERVYDFSPDTYKRKKGRYYQSNVTERYYCDIEKCIHSYMHSHHLYEHFEEKHKIPKKRRNLCHELYDTYIYNGQKYQCPDPKCLIKRKSCYKFTGHLRKIHHVDTNNYDEVLNFLKKYCNI